MGARHTNIKKQPDGGYAFSLRDGDQKARVEDSYTDAYEGWRTRCPSFKSAHPEDASVGLVEINARRIPGNKIEVKLLYETYTWEVTYPGREKTDRIKRYDCELSTREEDLLTHEKFKDLTEEEREVLVSLMARPPLEERRALKGNSLSDAAKGFIYLLEKGQSHYLHPGFVWVERFVTKNLSDLEMHKCGEVMDPPGPRPNPGTNRDYLYLGATASNTDDGEFWNVERRWMLSDKGKWSKIYDPSWVPAPPTEDP